MQRLFSSFIVQINIILNTNQFNFLVSALIEKTNNQQIFPTIYYFIILESIKTFVFIMYCINDQFVFYNDFSKLVVTYRRF